MPSLVIICKGLHGHTHNNYSMQVDHVTTGITNLKKTWTHLTPATEKQSGRQIIEEAFYNR